MRSMFAAGLCLMLVGLPRAFPAAAPVFSETNLSSAAIGAYLTNLVASTEIQAELKPALTNAYHQASVRAHERDALAAGFADYTNATAQATNQLAALRKSIEAESAVVTTGYSNWNSTELKAELAKEEAIEEAAKKALESHTQEEKRRKRRLAEIPKLIAESKVKLDEIKLAAAVKPAESDGPELRQANRLLLRVREAYRRQELETFAAEAKAYGATAEFQALQIGHHESKVSASASKLAALREALAKAGRAEADDAARKAKEEEKRMREAFWQSFPELSAIATNNTALADRFTILNEQVGGAGRDLTAREQALVKLAADFKTAKGRVQAFEAANVRINQKIGKLLRDNRRNLAEAISRTVIRRRLGEITDADVNEREYREEAQSLLPPARPVDELVQGFIAKGVLDANKPDRVQQVSARARELLDARQKHLTRLADESKSLGETLAKLNATDIEFGRETALFQSFIEERVLWVRSSDLISGPAIGGELKTLAGLLNPTNWAAVVPALWDGLQSEPPKGGLWLLALLIVFLGQPRVRGRLKAACEAANSRDNVSLWPTWCALPLTALISAPLPVLFWAISSILHFAVDSTLFSAALANALGFSATIYFTLGFFRHAARKPGLGSHHFSWSEGDRALIRRHLNWFLGTAVTLTFLIAFVEGDRSDSSQARLAFVALNGALTVFCFLLLHPVRGLSSRGGGRSYDTWRRLRFAICMVVPVGLGLASVVGYHFTAIELGWRLVDSIWLVLGIVLSGAVMLRWFYLERKRIALEKLDLRKAASDDTVMITAADQAVAAINITEIKEQTRSLLRVFVLVSLLGGLWGIWSDVTPALNILDRKALWHVEQTVDAATVDAKSDVLHGLVPATGEAKATVAATPKKIQVPITVADVLFALIALIIMGIAARNLPSFLEILILKHLKLETGGAYAITTIVQYVVVVVGIIIAFTSIGLTWEKVQWLAAAVTLGIGFGLQEIFANFVAGLILLFERPIRVGDVITVDGTSGTVSRIRIRATTITNWERQELVIPNKDLVTGRLTNWTLSDTTNRLVITVGIAYGSDTQLARETLFDILRNHPHVVADPPPRVTFDLFGESSLNFTIRAFLSTLDHRLETIHTLHQQIDDRFKEAGVEISFPQRDLHIRTGLEHLKPSGHEEKPA